jgi:tRNA(Ile)-lysidine synthetase-like protein
MQCKSVICSKKTGKKVKLSQEKQLIINYGFVEITDISSPLPYYEMPLPFDKITNINEKVSIHVYKGKKSINYKNINNFTIKATLNFDKICGSLIARKKINGDSYISGGITRSIKKYFSDSKISRQMREYIPVICDTEGALWVPGMNPCDRVSEKNAKNTITIVVEFENESRHCKSFTL